jgi:hypothetical protein
VARGTCNGMIFCLAGPPGGAMNPPRRRFLQLAASAAALPAVSGFGWAQTYPSRPITMIVPYPAGGLFDALARVLANPCGGHSLKRW